MRTQAGVAPIQQGVQQAERVDVGENRFRGLQDARVGERGAIQLRPHIVRHAARRVHGDESDVGDGVTEGGGAAHGEHDGAARAVEAEHIGEGGKSVVCCRKKQKIVCLDACRLQHGGTNSRVRHRGCRRTGGHARAAHAARHQTARTPVVFTQRGHTVYRARVPPPVRSIHHGVKGDAVALAQVLVLGGRRGGRVCACRVQF